MAEIGITNTPVDQGTGGCRVLTWLTLTTANDVGVAFLSAAWPDKTVHVEGTFGAAGAVAIEGTNEESPTNWHTLTDPQGDPLSFSAGGIKTILENTRWIRPKVTAGDGTTDIDVVMMIAGR